jgi:hypothetical protein
MLLLLLALGTFLAGLNLSLLPICFLGLALGLRCPLCHGSNSPFCSWRSLLSF